MKKSFLLFSRWLLEINPPTGNKRPLKSKRKGTIYEPAVKKLCDALRDRSYNGKSCRRTVTIFLNINNFKRIFAIYIFTVPTFSLHAYSKFHKHTYGKFVAVIRKLLYAYAIINAQVCIDFSQCLAIF